MPRHNDGRPEGNVKMDPMEECYFTMLSKRSWREAKIMASKVAAISAGANSKYFTKNSGAVGKAGEMIFERYLIENWETSWSPTYKLIMKTGGDVCDFLVDGLQIDVKTRKLHPADPEAQFGFYNRTIHLERFPMMVSEAESAKVQDVYVCCGYNEISREGYVLGWASYEEVVAKPINTNLRYPARCVPIGELHPIQYLASYLIERSKFVNRGR